MLVNKSTDECADVGVMHRRQGASELPRADNLS